MASPVVADSALESLVNSHEPVSTESLNLTRLEVEAKERAKNRVANLLQRPDQLDKVDQIRKGLDKKKSSVEAVLKTAVQSQLDGVRTGITQLHNALTDVRAIRQNLGEVEDSWKSVADLSDKLRKLKEENSTHCKLSIAVGNLRHIFNVPEHSKRTEELINEGSLLKAHKNLSDLERSRDDLLNEIHNQATPSITDTNTVKQYFSSVDTLCELLGKQLWVVLGRCLITVRREPTNIVTVLRIIEREEKSDSVWLKKYDRTGFLPPGRPKRWRQKCFAVLEEAVQNRVEGNQMEDRDTDKMWLVKHLEITRQLVLEDLRVAKTLCESCFPPDYDIVHKYVDMYHNAISQHLNDIIAQGLENNEIVTILQWVNDYSTKDLMAHPDLKIDVNELSPLLEERVISDLQNAYLTTLRSNFQEWMRNSLTTDMKDWHRDSEPDGDDKGYFNTPLPVLLFQMIEQNIDVAKRVSHRLLKKAVIVSAEEMTKFASLYQGGLQEFKEAHLRDRSVPQFFIHYMIANINSCLTFKSLILSLPEKYNIEGEAAKFEDGARKFDDIALACCDTLLDEVFLDLSVHINELLTRKWLNSPAPVDTICITMEDYCQDFVHIKPQHFQNLMKQAKRKILYDYLKALFARKQTFKSYEERVLASDKLITEADQFSSLFNKLTGSNEGASEFDVISRLAEVIKMRDTSMMSLEISGLVNYHSDLRHDQLINLMLMRGDVNRSEAKQIVQECLGEEETPCNTGLATIPAS